MIFKGPTLYKCTFTIFYNNNIYFYSVNKPKMCPLTQLKETFPFHVTLDTCTSPRLVTTPPIRSWSLLLRLLAGCLRAKKKKIFKMQFSGVGRSLLVPDNKQTKWKL